jgi:translation elongation factor EF-Tu-like GTPase
MKTFHVQDSFNITGRGTVLTGEIFEGYENCIGQQIKCTGKVNGIYTVKEAEKFRQGCFGDTGQPQNVGIIIEEEL